MCSTELSAKGEPLGNSKPEAAYSQLLQKTQNSQKLQHLLILVRLLASERSVRMYAQTDELVLWVEGAPSKCSDQKFVHHFLDSLPTVLSLVIFA
jgi:hypothetical protein